MSASLVVAGGADPGRERAGHALDQSGSAPPATILRAGRLFCVLFFSGVALLHAGLILPFAGRGERAKWLHHWSRFACRVLGLRLTTKGEMPEAGLLVCNHLSYLDIIALSSLRPCLFVAKRDVRAWPLFGWLARAGGAIFVARNRRTAAANDVRQISMAIESGILVVLFPEGTSSDGASVLPFKSSLLQAAVALRCPITAAGIDYQLADGSVADEVCYWRDMTLAPHLLNLFGKRSIESTIRFSRARARCGDRKNLARELRAEVTALRL
jgi:1-acyl-sn-glycerol-3-phosphate acyltransferase